MQDFDWRSEGDEPAPTRMITVNDGVNADVAFRRMSKGEFLLYTGDFQNAKQLLKAVERRIPKTREKNPPSLAERYRSARELKEKEHELTSHLLVELGQGYRCALRRAPDVAQACLWAWGEPRKEMTLVSLKALMGIIGAGEWRKKKISVPGLEGMIEPHYGVYLPTRTEYVELVRQVPDDFVNGKTLVEIGTGTGVLSFLLLQRGMLKAKGTDIDERAVNCANANAERLNLSKRFQAEVSDLFLKSEKADVVLFNAPWVPMAPRSRWDRAIFDEGHALTIRFLEDVRKHLNASGVAILIMSNFAELLGLREKTWLEEQFKKNRLEVVFTNSTTPKHSKASDVSDALHEVRVNEVTTLFVLKLI